MAAKVEPLPLLAGLVVLLYGAAETQLVLPLEHVGGPFTDTWTS